jgi:hypothetical protein
MPTVIEPLATFRFGQRLAVAVPARSGAAATVWWEAPAQALGAPTDATSATTATADVRLRCRR